MPPKQQLERKFGLFAVTNIVIANMIGAGIFTTSGFLMSELNNPVLMISLWLIGGTIALCGAFCYGELGATFPESGGEYAFLSKLYSPLTGFLSGWVSFVVGFSAPIAASSIGLSEYLYRAAPGIFQMGGLDASLTKKLFSIAVIAAFTLVHLRGVRFGAIVQNLLTLLKVFLIVALILVGFSFGTGDWNAFQSGGEFSFSFGSTKTIALSLMWIMFGYSGWNASVYIGAEIRNPQRNLPWSLLIGTGSVMLVYFLLNILFVYAIGPEEMKGVVSIGGLAVGKLFGPSLESAFSLFVAFALFSSISAFMILGPRVYHAMASNGHFFNFAGWIHPKYKVPSYSIVFQGLIAIVIVLSGTFDQILTYMGFSLGIFPLLAVFGLIKLRLGKKNAIKLPGYPVTAIIYLLSGVTILVFAFLERPKESSIALLTIAIGVPAYFAFKLTRSKQHPVD
ncbi:MAG: APC family permease [Puniceicoccaceae bacterium]